MEDLDYKVLEYIAKHGPVSVQQIENALPDVNSIGPRLDTLRNITNRMVIEKTVNEKHGSLTTSVRTGCFIATPLGVKSLQDYKHATRKHRKELWLKNAWIPILVSVVTNLVIAASKQLWPLIQQWASSFLSKTP